MTLVELTLFGIPLILISSAMLGFFTAYGVGANDVANAMGTSVGSKVLTIKQAVLVAAVFEFLGAFLAGGGVTQTIRKGVIDPALFEGNLEIFIYGMISALFAAGTWLLISSLRGWPVSTTHTIVGAIVGFGIYALGYEAINWSVVGNIGLSWITSPLSSAVVAGFFYYICKEFIIDKQSKFKGLIIRLYIFLAGFAISLITVTKGLKNIFKQQELFVTFQDSIIISALSALLFTFIFYYFSKAKLKNSVDPEAQFAYLMIFTSCAVAFAHGSNDVANAIGPLAAINQATSQLLNQPYTLETPLWILFLGAIGIVVGLATLGYRVMKTIGENIVKLTPSKGFSAQLAAALTVVIASQLDMPVSTTHTLVGAVIGIGLVEGASSINFNSVRTIVLSWVVTLPAGALLSIAFLEVFTNLFTY
ncbi:MAG: inorganic phosphate transporter [SAR86 cluster bacterium]|uniref:Phosphate transporter n=1 Tax=SAR86 cluster bacterium TaxID=2030880 RepID=A0A520MST8_9GAMM|nr:MAG: inorganic phosphate transporter [SAR86 cluster bacterium]|tara:strand:- start:63 stop:1322 length:1260 start_codon:yes stop_codon:yes gene_type:complete